MRDSAARRARLDRGGITPAGYRAGRGTGARIPALPGCGARPYTHAMLRSVLAISAGSSLGALLRWWFALRLNASFPLIPPGTLLANLIGGYIVGVAIALFGSYSALALEWRLFVITGFCGGLTTFSTFSAEVVDLLQQGRLSMALAAAAVHLVGSVLMTLAGIGTVAVLRGAS